jgi:class 3 adenylate cyclase
MRGDRRIRYARVNDADVAYQVNGDGPQDLLLIPGLLNHIESAATVPEVARHYERLAHFARVVLYDKRGTGLSGPLSAGGSPTIEDRVDEAVAVLDAVGSKTAAVYATADGGPVGIVLAAMHPDRVQQLAVYGSSARLLAAPDYPEGLPPEFASPAVLEESFLGWGDDDDPASLELILPSRASDAAVRRALAGMQRLAGSPRAAQLYFQVVVDTDVRDVLPMVRTPALVLHVRGDRLFPIEQGRYIAREMPDARLVEIDGDDHYYFWERSAGRVADELETFVTGRREVQPPDRSFAIVLFTDIVESTRHLAEVGDDTWRALLERHAELVGSVIPEYGGRLVKSTGDGMLATFDGPSRAARCARSLVDSLSVDGIEIRAGLHAGEVEWLGDDVAGIAVHIAARLCALAGATEVLSTGTLRDLTAGSDIAFVDRGEHELRGVPGKWSVHVIAP